MLFLLSPAGSVYCGFVALARSLDWRCFCAASCCSPPRCAISELFFLSPVPCIHSVTSEHFLVLGWDILHYSTLGFHGFVLAGFHRDLDSFVPVRNICFFNLACLLAYRHIAVCLHSVAFFRLVPVDVISIMCFAADIVICPCCLT